MRRRMMLALFLMTAGVGPASAQDTERGGLRTETKSGSPSRIRADDMIWNLIGLLGLDRSDRPSPQHEEDSYHPSSFE